MRGKTEQIIAAALKVFIKKGYLQATTQEIAKEANVAEMTLFRKFTSKQNLFLAVFQPLIARQFNSKLMQFANEKDSSEFFRKILFDRLETISQNKEIIKVVISESLLNHLDEEVNLPMMIFNSLKQAIEAHFSMKNLAINSDQCTRMIVGILLSHVLFYEQTPFHELPLMEKEQLINRYVEALNAAIE